MPLKSYEICEFLQRHVETCTKLIKSYENTIHFEFVKFEKKELEIYLFLHEFIVDYCEKNNIEEFDF